jgi:hypothetical protein
VYYIGDMYQARVGHKYFKYHIIQFDNNKIYISDCMTLCELRTGNWLFDYIRKNYEII